MKQTAQTSLVLPRWILTLNGDRTVLNDHCIVIEDHKIKKVAAREQVLRDYPDAPQIRLDDHLLMPGLINAHTHAAMTLLRGIADDIPLTPWLEEHIWPLESRFVDAEFVRTGTQLAIVEMLQSGTTCFNDMYFFPDVVAQAAEAAGMRACVGLIMLDFPTAWASGPDEYMSKGLRLADELKHSSLVTAAFAPHAPYTVSDEPLQNIRVIADELDIPVHMHIHETRHETEQSIDQYGMRPLERLSRLGLLSPRMLAVHMTDLLTEEIQSLAEAGVNIVHCPEANLKLASGIPPVKECLAAGINMAVGTDGCASNNDLNMLGELRCAALLAKGHSLDARTLDAWTALEMATINAARALNIDDVCGSLEKGKSADMIAIDLSDPCCQPVYQPASQVVYSAARTQVTHSWIEGRLVMENRQLHGLDVDQILVDVQQISKKIGSAADYDHINDQKPLESDQESAPAEESI